MRQHKLTKSVEGFEYHPDREEIAQSIRTEVMLKFKKKI